jgi:adenylate cyclase
MWLNFPGPFRTTFGHLSYKDVLRMSPQGPIASAVRGRVCLIAQAFTGVDLGNTPLEVNTPRCMIHATTANTIMTGMFLTSPGVWLEWLVLATIALLVSWTACVLGPVSFALVSLLVLAVWLFLSLALFVKFGWVVEVVKPLVEGGVAVFGSLQYKLILEARRRGEVENTLSRYFSPQVIARILANPGGFSLMTQRKELTILFSDIRGFTTMSETLDPDELQDLLREYFDRMTEIVFNHHGTVDKFIGDGMLAFFGDPEPCENHALDGVRAAIEMQRSVRSFSDARKSAGQNPIEIRIGINTGRVTVGKLGASRRVEYSVIGRVVNQAQRLEGAAPPGGILIGGRTCSLVRSQISIRASREIQVKGIDHPIEVHEVDF